MHPQEKDGADVKTAENNRFLLFALLFVLFCLYNDLQRFARLPRRDF